MIEMDQQDLTRKLNARERRRLNVHQMLPVDAIDPSCPTRNLVECHQTKALYRYGCSLAEMNLEIVEVDNVIKQRNFISRFRGFSSSISHQQRHEIRFTSIIFRLEQIRNLKRWSILSMAESVDEPNFILEPVFVVCVNDALCVFNRR